MLLPRIYTGYLHVYVIGLYQITLSLYIYMLQLIDSLMVAKQELVSVSAF